MGCASSLYSGDVLSVSMRMKGGLPEPGTTGRYLGRIFCGTSGTWLTVVSRSFQAM